MRRARLAAATIHRESCVHACRGKPGQRQAHQEHRLPLRQRQFPGQEPAPMHRGGRRRLRHGRAGQAISRRPGRPVERQRRPRAPGDQTGDRRAARQVELLFDLRQHDDAAFGRTGGAALPIDRAGGNAARILLVGRVRGGRGRHQARAPILAPDGRARARQVPLPAPSLSWRDARRAVAQRQDGVSRTIRAAAARLLPDRDAVSLSQSLHRRSAGVRPALRGNARAGDPLSGPWRRRRLHRRAHPGRRRGHRSPSHVLAAASC